MGGRTIDKFTGGSQEGGQPTWHQWLVGAPGRLEAGYPIIIPRIMISTKKIAP